MTCCMGDWLSLWRIAACSSQFYPVEGVITTPSALQAVPVSSDVLYLGTTLSWYVEFCWFSLAGSVHLISTVLQVCL